MQHRLTWHGHANFQITSQNATILIDPFFEGNPKADTPWSAIEKPDLILVTHDHGDHVGQAVEIARATGAHIGAIVGTAERLVERGAPKNQIVNGIGFNIGGTISFKGITVTMTPAFHSSDSGLAVGYIVTLEDGFTLYHAGDTSLFAGMELWGTLYAINLACLPIGGVFTMDGRQAALASKLLGCDMVAPMHWGTFPVLEQNIESFRRHLDHYAPEAKLLELQPGQAMVLEKPADTCGC